MVRSKRNNDTLYLTGSLAHIKQSINYYNDYYFTRIISIPNLNLEKGLWSEISKFTFRTH